MPSLWRNGIKNRVANEFLSGKKGFLLEFILRGGTEAQSREQATF